MINVQHIATKGAIKEIKSSIDTTWDAIHDLKCFTKASNEEKLEDLEALKAELVELYEALGKLEKIEE